MGSGAGESIYRFTQMLDDVQETDQVKAAMIIGYAIMRSNEFIEDKIDSVADVIGRLSEAMEAR